MDGALARSVRMAEVGESAQNEYAERIIRTIKEVRSRAQ
jgi:hypothetical protein